MDKASFSAKSRIRRVIWHGFACAALIPVDITLSVYWLKGTHYFGNICSIGIAAGFILFFLIINGSLKMQTCSVCRDGIEVPVHPKNNHIPFTFNYRYEIFLLLFLLLFLPFIAFHEVYLRKKHLIPWQRIWSIRRERGCLRIEFALTDYAEADNVRFLGFEWPLENPYEFKQAILEFAPKGNPLREYVERAL